MKTSVSSQPCLLLTSSHHFQHMEASAVVMSEEDKAGVTEKVELNNTDAGLEPESHQNERQLETDENGLMWSIAGVRYVLRSIHKQASLLNYTYCCVFVLLQ